MVLILTFDFVVKHILKAPDYRCICCHGLRPMLCLKKTFPVWGELTSPMLASSCVTSVRDNMRTWVEEASLRFWRHIIHLSSTASLRGPEMIVLELRNWCAFPCFRPFVQPSKLWRFHFTQTFLESEVESSYIAAKCFEQSNEFWSSSLASPSSSCCQMIC